jgi:hypothetical protein
MKLKKILSSETTGQSQPNFAEMILGWPPFKIVSVSAVLFPRWPPLLKIEISSNGQNCSILSQKVPKFELYKHNDELFNKYYGIFFDWHSSFRGEDFFKSHPHFFLICIIGQNRQKLSKMAAMTKYRNFFKWPKLLYFKPESSQI